MPVRPDHADGEAVLDGRHVHEQPIQHIPRVVLADGIERLFDHVPEGRTIHGDHALFHRQFLNITRGIVSQNHFGNFVGNWQDLKNSDPPEKAGIAAFAAAFTPVKHHLAVGQFCRRQQWPQHAFNVGRHDFRR